MEKHCLVKTFFCLVVMLLVAGCAAPTATPLLAPTVAPALVLATETAPLPTPTPLPAASATPVPSYTPTILPSPTADYSHRAVVAEFFYWYDAQTRAHMDAAGPLSLHLPGGAEPNWRDPAWYRTEFADMADAGIDIAACGYWIGEGWADGGLKLMVEALDVMEVEGQAHPGVAMFYETVPLWGRDFTTPAGKQYMYIFIQRFFSLVPRQYWGLIDRRPVIWFYDTGGGQISAYDQSTFDLLCEQFSADFGTRPFIVLDRSWTLEREIHVDGTYTWGVAFLGYQPRDTIAGAGPGYDDHLIPSRAENFIIVPRAEGEWYRNNLYQALASGKDILWLETWNEHHEATNINHTEEYGRQYINLTREYAAMFKRGEIPHPPPAGGAYSAADSVSFVVEGDSGQTAGLSLLQVDGDGLWKPASMEAREAAATASEGPGRYLYFQVDPSFASFTTPVDLVLEVEYLAPKGEPLILDYDSLDPESPARFMDRYRMVTLAASASGKWAVARITLAGVRFTHGQNGGADFRLWAGENQDLAVRRVSLRK